MTGSVEDAWARLADPFVDGAYASFKGRVRTFVLHQQLLGHLPPPPATILDVGGGAGHQSFPLAAAGYPVTLLDPSPTMLDKASFRLATESPEVRERVDLVQARGEDAAVATGGRTFDVVLCHGVLMYLNRPETMIAALCRCVTPGGLVSLMALNARTLAVRPAVEGRWADALTAFDATGEPGVLGVDTRADTVDGLSKLLLEHGVEEVAWYGVWLFSDWMTIDPSDEDEASTAAKVELAASRRDPYRQLSRVFHLLGRRRPDVPGRG